MNAVYEQHECVNSSTSQAKKRLSGLAFAISLLAEQGITSTAEIARRSGFTDRAIRRAKAELAARNNDAAPRTPDAATRKHESAPPASSCRSEPRAPARIDSSFGRDSYSEEVEESADAATPAKPSRFAFEGRTVRLSQADFDRWRKAYPAIADLGAALTAADDYYTEHLKPGEKWFHRVSRWLANENGKALAPPVTDWREEKRRRNAAFLAMARGETVQ